MKAKGISQKSRKNTPATKRPITWGGGARKQTSRAPKQRRDKKLSGPVSKKTATRRKAVRRRTSKEDDMLKGLFPAVLNDKRRFGVGVLLAVIERQGDYGDIRFARVEQFSERPAQRPKTTLLAKAEPADVARMLVGLAHADRLRIARAIMTGANTHQLISEAVGLKTGPLYHHLRELQRARLLITVSRNRYDLSELGRAALLVTAILGTWDKKGRSTWRRSKLTPPKRVPARKRESQRSGRTK